MICVRLNGGLGNQLFQYAAGRSLALRLGTELLLDTSTLQRRFRRDTMRQLEMGHFNHVGRLATPRESHMLPWLHHVAPYSHWLSPWFTFVEKEAEFNVSFDKLLDQTYLVGYWQSFRYFSEFAKSIYAELQPIESLSDESKRIEERMESFESVAIHVRRGDYVSLKSAATMHGVLSVNYYSQSIARIRSTVSKSHFFVFSDDPAWCEANLPLPSDATTYINQNSGSNAWQDLILMSRCRHTIIANSSFSWWGAWLADYLYGTSNRLVFSPQRWFIGQKHDTKDRFPSHWQVVA